MLPPPVINTGHPTFSVTYWCSSNFVSILSVCLCVSVCVQVHPEASRGHQIPWEWNYKCL